jgi:mannose-6-phosphate isomerase-like protein (cupin superfamily)
MMKRIATLSLMFLCASAPLGYAQQAPQASAREDALDPTPIDAATDPNLDMFVNDWKNATPRSMYGGITFHDILTKLQGPDPQHPSKRGAVLTDITAISHAQMASGAKATGRAAAGERQVFYTVSGTGSIVVNGKTHEVKKGVGFMLTPDTAFALTSTGGVPLAFYVRTEPLPASYVASPDLTIVNRFDNDRRVGAHWAHINNGGINGLTSINIAPHTMPQPHSHPQEECWIMVEGETILSLGKHIRRMTPGQAYKIPPTGITAHSNLNLGDEPVEMIYLGPASREGGGGRPAQGGRGQGGPGGPGGAVQGRDFARLDNSPYNRATEQDIDMFMGDWRNAFPRIMHGSLYFRDMLTALQGPDDLHPARRGAVLTNAEAVSYVQLEPGATAHRVDGELKNIQQTFVVSSGTGVITAGSTKVDLVKDQAFIITPGLEFKLTNTGDRHMAFYVISEKLSAGFTPRSSFQVFDNRSKAPVTTAWANAERPLIAKGDGLSQYGAVTQVTMKGMTMSRPYSSAASVEEIWIATDGDVDVLIGKELRKLRAGTAYRAPSTGLTAHTKINASGQDARLLYFAK